MKITRSPTTRRLGAVLLAVPALLWCLSGVAIAHVTVHPDTATADSYTAFTFRAPAEKPKASTVKLVIVLPAAAPIPVVSVQPVPGWHAAVAKRKLPKPVQTDDGPVSDVVARITWSIDDKADAIAPGQFQQFRIEAGPLPETKRLVFKALQYYSDGSVVRWIDPPIKGGEPAHPEPTVTLGAGPSSPAASGSSAALVTVNGDGWIAVAAFVAGLLGFAAGTTALVIARRSTNSESG